jgi:D-hexose-6-phosphate mutarotase
MRPIDLETLNESFAIADHITFAAGPGGLPVAQVRNAYAAATVSLRGAQVLAFQPHHHDPVLWVSAHSLYQPGKAIRGGIPVCWPWFGPHASDPAKPAHGFARTSLWSVLSAAALADGATQVRLRLADDDASYALWPHAFDLRLVVTVGAELRAVLIARNPGAAPYTYSGALHSYFSVSDIAAISIHGLDGCAYIDKVDGQQRKIQQGPVTIQGETDRVYLNTGETCVIEDPGLDRRITIGKAGSHTTVVWNPWAERARQLADFGDEEYHGMICVETANADGDSVTLAPGGEHRLTAIISVEEIRD